MCKQDSI